MKSNNGKKKSKKKANKKDDDLKFINDAIYNNVAHRSNQTCDDTNKWIRDFIEC